MTPAEDTTPAAVEIERQKHMTIVFDDGLRCVFAVAVLRGACPCATCRVFSDRGDIPWPRGGQSTEIAIVDAEFVGAWGISITWSDRHSTGIYSWAYLRRLWLAGAIEP